MAIDDRQRQRPVAEGGAVPEASGGGAPPPPGKCGGARCDDNSDGRQRDIFPLPLFDSSFDTQTKLGRGCWRRVKRRLHWQAWADEGISCLNSMAGHDHDATLAPTSGQLRCLDQIADAYKSVGPAPADPSFREGALGELLASSSIYKDCKSDVRPYVKDLVSWPSPGSTPVPLAKCLGKADSERLGAWQSHMLRPAAETEALLKDSRLRKPFCDAALVNRPRTYADFLWRLESCGMLRWTLARGRTGTLGPFFVGKGDKLRMVLDTRLVNMRFVDPPSTRLASAGAMSRVEQSPEFDVFLGSGDIECAFYRLGIDRSLGEHFSLPVIRARWLGVTCVDGVAVGPDDYILPCLTVLPMGWSWALHLCQLVTAEALLGAGIPESMCVKEGRAGVRLRDVDDVAGAAYVDNYAVLGGSQKAVDIAL